MPVTIDDVRHVATLARLAFSDEELEGFTSEMNAILAHFERLREIRVEGVEPAYRILRRTNVLREDEIGEALSQEDALANAPDQDGGFFRVPGFLPES